MQYEDIVYEVNGRTATIRINRPRVYNAFRPRTVVEMLDAFLTAGWSRDIGSIVLTGTGDKAFCTGGDQSDKAGQYGDGNEARGPVGMPVEELHTVIRDVPKPVIAKVRGYAIGGGNVLATLCDLTIASGDRDLRAGRPEDGLGRRRLRHRLPRALRGREEGPRDLVHVPALRCPGSARDGTVQRRRAGRAA